jgi:hypothetical protein
MKVQAFESERWLSVWQNQVRYDLTETGVHPLYLHELVTEEELLQLREEVQLRYIQTNGTPFSCPFVSHPATARVQRGRTVQRMVSAGGAPEHSVEGRRTVTRSSLVVFAGYGIISPEETI